METTEDHAETVEEGAFLPGLPLAGHNMLSLALWHAWLVPTLVKIQCGSVSIPRQGSPGASASMPLTLICVYLCLPTCTLVHS